MNTVRVQYTCISKFFIVMHTELLPNCHVCTLPTIVLHFFFSLRWDINITRWCLVLWARSPKAYEDLRKMSGLLLPSESTLRTLKNSVPQDAGFDQVCEQIIFFTNFFFIQNLTVNPWLKMTMIDVWNDYMYYCCFQALFTWMYQEANRLNISDEGRAGGLVLDEMSIQPSVEFERRLRKRTRPGNDRLCRHGWRKQVGEILREKWF